MKFNILILSLSLLLFGNKEYVYVSNSDPSTPMYIIDAEKYYSLYISSSGGTTVDISEVSAGYVEGTNVVNMGIATNSSNTSVYALNRTDKTLDVIDVGTKAVVSQILLGDDGIYQVAITPDNSKAFVTSATTTNFYEIDLTSYDVKNHGSSGLFNNSLSLIVTPDGKSVYVANGTGTIVAWNINDGSGVNVNLNGFSLTFPQSMVNIPGVILIYLANVNGLTLVINTLTNTVEGPVTDYCFGIGPETGLTNLINNGTYTNGNPQILANMTNGAYQQFYGFPPFIIEIDGSNNIAVGCCCANFLGYSPKLDALNGSALINGLVRIGGSNVGSNGILLYITDTNLINANTDRLRISLGGSPVSLLSVKPYEDDFIIKLVDKYRKYFVY